MDLGGTLLGICIINSVLGKATEITGLSCTFMFGEELQVQDLLSASGQTAQQMRLAATRCSAHHHQLQIV
jgi:hypothetical protein